METIWSHISVAVAAGLSLYSFATEYLRQLSRTAGTPHGNLRPSLPLVPLLHALSPFSTPGGDEKRKVWRMIKNRVDPSSRIFVSFITLIFINSLLYHDRVFASKLIPRSYKSRTTDDGLSLNINRRCLVTRVGNFSRLFICVRGGCLHTVT